MTNPFWGQFELILKKTHSDVDMITRARTEILDFHGKEVVSTVVSGILFARFPTVETTKDN